MLNCNFQNIDYMSILKLLLISFVPSIFYFTLIKIFLVKSDYQYTFFLNSRLSEYLINLTGCFKTLEAGDKL